MLLFNAIPVNAIATTNSNVITNAQIEAAIAWGESYLSPTDSSKFYGLCAAFVFHAYNEGAGIANSSYATATAMGNALITNTDTNPPRGAFVFWYVPDVPAGHVALSLGNGKIIHSWGNKPKCVVSGTIANVSNYYGASNYRGWGAPIPGYKLATDTGGGTTIYPKYTSISHSSITTDNAVLSGTCQNSGRITLKTGGFYISTRAGAVANGQKITDNIPSSYQTAATIPCSYNLKNEYGITLQSGTTYYYVFYVTDASGNSYYSQEYSFTTTKIPVTSVVVSPGSKALNIGNTTQLSATVSPTNASDRNVTWSSSNTAVATVSTSGLVTAKSVGSAIITATAADGSGKSGSATITVSCNHSSGYTILPAVSPTCTQTGLTEGRRCNACSVITVAQTTVPSTGHSHTATVTPPTCTAGGYTTYTCHCGDSYVADYTNEAGHSWSEWSVGMEPTATTEGQKFRTCGSCGETEFDTIPATGESENVYSGTCGENLTWTLDGEGTLTISGTGAMGNYDYDNKAPWYSQGDSILSVVVENGVTTIGENAFEYCTNLSRAEIGNRVTSIGNYAFESCESLSSITLPDSVTSIGYYAFAWCESISSITIPEGVTDIGNFAFAGCSISSITIPDSVNNISHSAFEYCDNLTGIWVDDQNQNYSSDDRGVLFDKNKRELIQAPGGISGAYSVPQGVTSIGYGAFNSCTNLSSIILPRSLSSIKYEAFWSCENLSSITIPEGVTSISERAFYGCDSLTGIWVDEQNQNYSNDDCGVLFDKNKSQLLQAPAGICGSYSVPEGVADIGNYAFYYCESLTNIIIPDSVSSIGGVAFYYCTSLDTVHYAGTEAQRADISIGNNNEYLTDATWHYECDGVVCMNPEAPPTEPKPTEPKPTEPKPTEPKPTEPKPTEPKPAEPKPTTPPAESDKPATNPFVDVPGDAFYHDPVLWAVDNAVTNGLDATHFGPDAGCTRAHVVTFLWRAAGQPAPASSYNPFTDVLPGAYYYDAVLWAVEKGITNGVSATAFAPDQTCTRGQIVTFLWRYQHSPSASGTTSFIDIPAGQYYSTAVAWAVANNITNGMGDGIFAPDATCTRGQIVTFLYRAMA